MEKFAHRDDSPELPLAQRAALAATLLAACAHTTGRETPAKPQLINYKNLHFVDAPEDAFRDALDHLQVDETGYQKDGSLVSCMLHVTRAQLAGVEDELRGLISGIGFEGAPVHPANTYSSNLWPEKRAELGGGFISSRDGPYTVCVRGRPGDEPFIPYDVRSKNGLHRRNPRWEFHKPTH